MRKQYFVANNLLGECGSMQITVISEGLLLKNGSRGGGFSNFPHTATSCKCLPCGLTVIHLRLCDRKKSLGLVALDLDKIHIRRE